jgi:hypothetical protein
MYRETRDLVIFYHEYFSQRQHFTVIRGQKSGTSILGGIEGSKEALTAESRGPVSGGIGGVEGRKMNTNSPHLPSGICHGPFSPAIPKLRAPSDDDRASTEQHHSKLSGGVSSGRIICWRNRPKPFSLYFGKTPWETTIRPWMSDSGGSRRSPSIWVA